MLLMISAEAVFPAACAAHALLEDSHFRVARLASLVFLASFRKSLAQRVRIITLAFIAPSASRQRKREASCVKVVPREGFPTCAALRSVKTARQARVTTQLPKLRHNPAKAVLQESLPTQRPTHASCACLGGFKKILGNLTANLVLRADLPKSMDSRLIFARNALLDITQIHMDSLSAKSAERADLPLFPHLFIAILALLEPLVKRLRRHQMMRASIVHEVGFRPIRALKDARSARPEG